MKRLNLHDKIFGRLKVTAPNGIDSNGAFTWKCKCTCGKEIIIDGSRLKNGVTKSCGCLRIELGHYKNLKHGKSKTPTYTVWEGIKSRCTNKKVKEYKNYGGRGIDVCKRWKNSFENFYKDMGEKPKDMSIDRINNNGNYEPNNCRWATQIEQSNNMRLNKYIVFNNEKLTVPQWARKIGIKAGTLFKRLHNGWNIQETFALLPIIGNNQNFRGVGLLSRNALGRFVKSR